MNDTQRWIRRGYASERRQGRDPITAAANVRNSYAGIIARQCDMFGRPTTDMLDSWRCADQWLTHVMARETTQRPGDVNTLLSALHASKPGPAIAQAVS